MGEVVMVEHWNPEDWEVCWNGEMAKNGTAFKLVPDRSTKVSDVWTSPARIYNHTGNHIKRTKVETVVVIEPSVVEGSTSGQGTADEA